MEIMNDSKVLMTITALMLTIGAPAAFADHHGDDQAQDKSNNVKKAFPVKEGDTSSKSATPARKDVKKSGVKTDADGSVKSGGNTDSSTIGKGTGNPESTTSGSGTGYSGYRDKN